MGYYSGRFYGGFAMGRNGVGDAQRIVGAGGKGSAYVDGRQCNFGPRNSDGTWVAGVERGPAKHLPFPVGAVFGELICLRWERQYSNRKNGTPTSMFNPVMRCSCGWEGFVHRSNIKKGASTRCGACARKKAVFKRWEAKGYIEICPDPTHRDRLLDRISAIIVRCSNPESATYPDYGGRGITVHPAWVENRAAFLEYLVTLPGWDKPELQLDRRDNNGGYVPGNLRFITRSENMVNKRKITAREVVALRQRITALETENADLRHRLGGAA